MSLTFHEIARLCEKIEGISSTLEIRDVLGEFLKDIEDDGDLYNTILFLMGDVFPAWDERDLGIGIGLLYEALKFATGLSKEEMERIVKEMGDVGLAVEFIIGKKKQQLLYVEEITLQSLRNRINEISRMTGKKAQINKIRALADIFMSVSPLEARYLARLVLGELRIGVGEGIMRDAIARAFSVSSEQVERAYMLISDLGKVAVIAKNEGNSGLKKVTLTPHIPIRMMLAQMAKSIEEALKDIDMPVVEWKYDGSRVQVHKTGDKLTIYSRRLENVTPSLPEIVEGVNKSVKEDVILDGEVIAIKDGRPMPFQNILRRFRRKYDVREKAEEIPLYVIFFDILYWNGIVLIDLPLKERRKILEKVVKESERVSVATEIMSNEISVIREVYTEALKAGHEGIMMKNPESHYIPGRRGKNWLKLKPTLETLDLVVIGGEWGEGRRARFIGSYELACYDPSTNSFLRIGRVATGFSDEQLEELTGMFKDLIEGEEGKIIHFIPKIVFEVAYEEIQKSPKYESGFALRFPRLVRVRDDKSPEDADTIDRIEQIYESQF
jgi:DNA ligase-1